MLCLLCYSYATLRCVTLHYASYAMLTMLAVKRYAGYAMLRYSMLRYAALYSAVLRCSMLR